MRNNLMGTTTGPLTLEEMLPPPDDLPRPVIPAGVKTATVRLKVGYWPAVPLENTPPHDASPKLFAGQRVKLPIDEAKALVAKGAAELVFE